MRPATPCVTLLIAGVALKTRFVGLRRRQPGRIDDVLGLKAFNVLSAVAMAALAACGARIRQEFGAFAMNVQGEGLHNLLMALLALRSNHGSRNGLLLRLPRSGLRLGGSGNSRPHRDKNKAGKGCDNQ